MEKQINKKTAFWFCGSFALLYTTWHIVHSFLVIKATLLFNVMKTAEEKAECTRWYNLMQTMDQFNPFHMQAYKGVMLIIIITILVLFIRFGIKATTLTIGISGATSFISVFLIEKISQSGSGLVYYYANIIRAEVALGASFGIAFLIYLVLWLFVKQEKMELLRHTIR